MNERVYTFDYSKLFEKLSELQQGQNRFKIYSQSSLFVIKNDNDESYLFNGYNDIVYFSTTSDNGTVEGGIGCLGPKCLRRQNGAVYTSTIFLFCALNHILIRQKHTKNTNSESNSLYNTCSL